ncbi:MAG: branched-chain amino acid ABC transporter permease [Kiritimatiellae bacterium]|nr:branched-chain amino acid ABC transporter permease [Kiritimatiellia bacterium]
MKHKHFLSFLLSAVVVVGFQLLATGTGREYYLTQLTTSAYYAVVVMALSLLMGYAGQVSLGHAAFFAIGGYTTAVLTTTNIGTSTAPWFFVCKRLGVLVAREVYGREVVSAAPFAAFVVAMLVAAVAAMVIGYPSLRLRGHYLAMATLGFCLIVSRIVVATRFFGAADGIHGVPPWYLFPGFALSGAMNRVGNYYFAWGFALVVLWLLLNLVHSRAGRALRAIHDSELAANTMGVDTARYKLKTFLLSAVLAAATGSFMTHYNRGIGPSEAGALKSVRYVALVAAGGMANLWGALVVSTVLNFLSDRGYFGTFDEAVFGSLLITIVSVTPEGPLRPLGMWFRRWLMRVKKGTLTTQKCSEKRGEQPG